MTTYLELLDLWESDQALAADLNSKLSRVQKWRARRAIPSKAWPEFLAAAKRRGFAIDADTLIRIGSRKARKPRAPREVVVSQ